MSKEGVIASFEFCVSVERLDETQALGNLKHAIKA